jgi:thymidylate synthase (FAD)
MHFVRLRADHHAQYEIRAYADVLLNIIKMWVPYTYEAFIEHVRDSVTLSKTSFSLVKRMLAGEHITQENSGLGKREWLEFSTMFGVK